MAVYDLFPPQYAWAVTTFLILSALFVLAHFKTSRADGTLVKGAHPYRRLMWFVMPTRNECVVYYEDKIRAENLIQYLAEAKPKFECDVTHAAVAALNVAIGENPRMNQFVIGRRLYKRKERAITFSMKRKALDRKAKLAVVRIPMDNSENFASLAGRMNDSITHQRSGEKTHSDKEYALFNLLPRTVLRLFTWLFHALDYINLLPYAFTKEDSLYTSAVVANLGSLGMQPGFHHLYEWGTSSVFMMVGAIQDEPVVEDGSIVPGKVLTVRYSYDERIDDGLSTRRAILRVQEILSNPVEHLGCLNEDKATWKPMVQNIDD
ncbi:MAG: hypothetical protein CL930_06715 [Deltaproteobacteria bacterium]|nr:hypothetical protein [Deltaproteobacteria bacterium]